MPKKSALHKALKRSGGNTARANNVKPGTKKAGNAAKRNQTAAAGRTPAFDALVVQLRKTGMSRAAAIAEASKKY